MSLCKSGSGILQRTTDIVRGLFGADPRVLREAADIIRTRGLNKGGYENSETGAVCAIGAIWHAHKKVCPLAVHYLHAPETAVLAHLLGAEITDPAFGIRVVKWNDQPERTANDVITLLEQGAEKLEADQ